MATDYIVQLQVELEPVQQPWVAVSVAGHKTTQQLSKSEIFVFKFNAAQGPCVLEIEHFDKSASDARTAVIIKSVSFFGITDPKFVWSGTYWPQYPEPWFSEQTRTPAAELTNTNYLGWNGVWRLRFDVPVFSWMHRVLDLGWLYN